LDLPPGDALRDFLIDTLEAQIKALARYQDEATGLWHTLVDDKTSYLEASATAGFAYGVLKAVRKRYVGKEHQALAIKALKGVLAHIDDKGELQQVSFGTPVFDTLQGYKDIPLTSMPYGQSLALLALGEFQRAFI
jgi:unsaturated rhamnogalacturonyl hydrolase